MVVVVAVVAVWLDGMDGVGRAAEVEELMPTAAHGDTRSPSAWGHA